MDISFRLSWLLSSVACTDSDISSGNLVGYSSAFGCRSGCSGSFGNLKIKCTNYNIKDNYMSGVNTITHTFSGSSNNLYEFR